MYEGRFQVDRNQGKMTRIDDVAMPWPLLHDPYIRCPLPPPEASYLASFAFKRSNQEESTTSELPTHNSLGIAS